MLLKSLHYNSTFFKILIMLLITSGSCSNKPLLMYEGPQRAKSEVAIIDTGKRKIVWVDLGQDKYLAKAIKTGFESEGYTEIKHGLGSGEKVVIDGNFLLDAQAQLFGGYDENEQSTHSSHQH